MFFGCCSLTSATSRTFPSENLPSISFVIAWRILFEVEWRDRVRLANFQNWDIGNFVGRVKKNLL